MALETVIPRACFVLQNRNVGNLPRLRRSRILMMAIVAVYPLLGRVVTVPEDIFKSILRLQSTVIRGESMTDAARSDLAFLSVAAKTIVVGLKSDGDRLSGSAGLMT